MLTIRIDHAYEGEKEITATDKADADRKLREMFAAGYVPLKGFGIMIEDETGAVIEKYDRDGVRDDDVEDES
jgi:hypothetical protein